MYYQKNWDPLRLLFWGRHIGPALMHSESAKKIEFIGLKWLGYYVEQGSALGFEVFQFFLIEILLQSWKK